MRTSSSATDVSCVDICCIHIAAAASRRAACSMWKSEIASFFMAERMIAAML
jgi:hypothetical protein